MREDNVNLTIPSDYNDEMLINAFKPTKNGIVQNDKIISFDELFINNYSNKTKHKENYIPYLFYSILDMYSFFETLNLYDHSFNVDKVIMDSIIGEKELQEKKNAEELKETLSDCQKLMDFAMDSTLKLSYNDKWTYNLTRVLYAPLMKKENLSEYQIFYLFKQCFLHKDEFFRLIISLLPQIFIYVITMFATFPLQAEDYSAYPNGVSNLNSYAKLKAIEFYLHLSELMKENKIIQTKTPKTSNIFALFGFTADMDSLLFPFAEESISLEELIRNQINDTINFCFTDNDLGQELILCEGNSSVFEEYITSKSDIHNELTEQEMCKFSFFISYAEKFVEFEDSSIDYALSMTTSLNKIIARSIYYCISIEKFFANTMIDMKMQLDSLLNEKKELNNKINETKKDFSNSEKEKRTISEKLKTFKMANKILEEKLQKAEDNKTDKKSEKREEELLQQIADLNQKLDKANALVETKTSELSKLSTMYKELNSHIFAKTLEFDEMVHEDERVDFLNQSDLLLIGYDAKMFQNLRKNHGLKFKHCATEKEIMRESTTFTNIILCENFCNPTMIDKIKRKYSDKNIISFHGCDELLFIDIIYKTIKG